MRVIQLSKKDIPAKINLRDLQAAIEAVAPGARVEYLPARSETRPDGQGGYLEPVFLDAELKIITEDAPTDEIDGEDFKPGPSVEAKIAQVLRDHKPAKTEDEEQRDAYLTDFANRIYEALQLLKADGRLNGLIAPGVNNDATKR